MRTALTFVGALALLASGCGSSDVERPQDDAVATPAAWAPIDGSVGSEATPADAAAFRDAVEAGLAPALAPRLGEPRYLQDVDFEGQHMRLLVAPAGQAGWCLAVAGLPSPGPQELLGASPACVLAAGSEPALAVATLGGPLPEWMSREGGTVVYGRARSDAATIEIELSDDTNVGGGPPVGGTFAMGPFERGRTPRAVIARSADGAELARVELWSEADERAMVDMPQQTGATNQPPCASIGLPLTGPSGSGYGAFAVGGNRTTPPVPNPTVMPAGGGGLLLFGTLPEAAREVEVRFATESERHPVPDSCFTVGIASERITSEGAPTAVAALGADGAVLETYAVRPTWLDFPPLP